MSKNIYVEKNGSHVLEMNTPKLGKVESIIDSEDLNRVKAFHWIPRKDKGGAIYIVASLRLFNDGKTRKAQIQLHRLIFSFESEIVDHINSDSLDNRKSNLRPATAKQNCSNRSPNKKSKHGFKGVCFSRKNGKFRAYIYHNHKNIHLGFFNEIEAACTAYNLAALEYFGEFAKFNRIHR
jgi:hypothetical protein